MTMNWDDNRVFLSLAREGTLSGAAAQLGAGVATVSRRVERLEKALGVPLFLRHQTGYRLTDQGEALLPRAEAVELAMLEMQSQASKDAEIRGLVRLATVETLVNRFVVPALQPVLTANPGLDVEILFSAAMVNIHRHDADLALRMVRPERGNLLARHLAWMGMGLYGPADGPGQMRLVCWPAGNSYGDEFRQWAGALAGKAQAQLAINTLAGQVAAVQRGMGVAILPHFLARDAGLRLIAARLPNGAVMQRPIFWSRITIWRPRAGWPALPMLSPGRSPRHATICPSRSRLA